MSGAPRTLVLVRHAQPEMRADRPASRWTLAPRGREQAAETAGRIGAHRPGIVASSPQPKAVETARILGAARALEPRIVAGLEEHARATVPFFPDPADFRAAVLAMLSRPDERVFGEESAAESLRRFRTALEALMAAEAGNVAVVAHGTVISLWLSTVIDTPAREIWTSLGFCGFAAIDWPRGRLIEWFAGA